MAKRKKLTRKDFEPEPTPVWFKEGNVIKPTPFFQNWWQKVAERRFGDKERCLDAAIQLGYIWKFRDPNTGEINHDPIGFDYDPMLYRKSLDIPENMPLVRQDDSRQDGYQQLWKSLMSEQKEIKPYGK